MGKIGDHGPFGEIPFSGNHFLKMRESHPHHLYLHKGNVGSLENFQERRHSLPLLMQRMVSSSQTVPYVSSAGLEPTHTYYSALIHLS